TSFLQSLEPSRRRCAADQPLSSPMPDAATSRYHWASAMGKERSIHNCFCFLGPPLLWEITEPVGKQLKRCIRIAHTPSVTEIIEIFLSGEQKPQETNASILTRLINRQKNQVIPQARLTHHTIGDSSVASKRLDRMLTIIVVPRNAVILQEGKELLTISH